MVEKCEEASSSNPRRSGLTIVTAEKIFGWRNVHKQDGELTGKKQDTLCLTTRGSANEQADAYLNGVEQTIIATWKCRQ